MESGRQGKAGNCDASWEGESHTARLGPASPILPHPLSSTTPPTPSDGHPIASPITCHSVSHHIALANLLVAGLASPGDHCSTTPGHPFPACLGNRSIGEGPSDQQLAAREGKEGLGDGRDTPCPPSIFLPSVIPITTHHATTGNSVPTSILRRWASRRIREREEHLSTLHDGGRCLSSSVTNRILTSFLKRGRFANGDRQGSINKRPL